MKTLEEIEPRRWIKSLPITITNRGSYYVASNLFCSDSATYGITILADNVTIDLNGFALLGTSNTLDGIYAHQRSNIVVKNGILEGWGQTGVGLSGSEGCHVRSVIAANNGDGIAAGDGALIRNCTARNNARIGINIGGGIVRDCVSLGNGDRGFYLDYCLVISCVAKGNAGPGFETIHDTTIRESASLNNRLDGILIDLSAAQLVGNTIIANNTVGHEFRGGIRIMSGGSRVERNHIVFDAGYGIVASAGGGSTIILNSTKGDTNRFASIGTNNNAAPWVKAGQATNPFSNTFE